MDRRAFLAATGIVAAGAVAGGVRWVIAGSDPPPGEPARPLSAPAPAPEPATSLAPQPTVITEATASPSTSTTIANDAATLSVLCREAWGARPAVGHFREHEINQITVHHTAVLLETNTEAPGRLRQHQSYHQDLGWPDIAYHFLIDANGHIYEGRPVTAVGDTATDYDPTGHLLICCEGNFDVQAVPASQYDALVSMLTWGINEFDIAVPEIRGHRDLASTTCPGDALYALLAPGPGPTHIAPGTAAPPELKLECGPGAGEIVNAVESGKI